MKAIFKTLCGCSRMLEIEDLMPEIKLPLFLESSYAEYGAKYIEHGYRTFYRVDFGVLDGEKIIIYKEK